MNCVYLYVIENECNGVIKEDVRVYSNYDDASKQLFSDYDSNKRIEKCDTEYVYREGLNPSYEEPRTVGSWAFMKPMLFIKTVSGRVNYVPTNITRRAIFKKELL